VDVRRDDKRAPESVAWDVFARAPVVWFASVRPDGEPVLRPLHAVVIDRSLCVHGAPAGEKLATVGQRVVAMAAETLAEVPSTFTHPERACPATTFYRSASAHGRLEPVDDPHQRAEVLQALMERFQPQGGYRPITADDPMYRASVAGLTVLRLRPDRVVAKVAAAAGKRPSHRHRMVDQLWARGLPADAAAAQAVVDADPSDDGPAWLTGPHGTRLVLAADERHVAGAVALLRDQYWNADVDDGRLARAQRGSPVWMVLVSATDEVLATARALSDGVKTSYVADVAVHPDWQGRGLGRFLIERLADHPLLRHTRIDLLTRTAGPFYARQGFERLTSEPWRRAR
jgi:GNAT superfamily N-acetyltransferase/nitroimidazol reductase NimA-like FMN-containing flavoprotein (pyridoxamine 5'-phosphate oxidase superfamily)